MAVEALLWLVGFEERALQDRAKVKGTVKGLQAEGLYVEPTDFTIVDRLAAEESIGRVLIAYHPPGPAESKPAGDIVLADIAHEYRTRLTDELEDQMLRAGAEERRQRLSNVAARLASGALAVKAKCLRQEPKSGRPDSSYLFDRLAAIAKANHERDAIEAPIQALVREFDVDRGVLFLEWQGIVNQLCALDVDLCALDLLLARDLKLGGESAAKYLREMVRGDSWVTSLRGSLRTDVDGLAARWGGPPPPDIGGIYGLLDAFVAISRTSPAGASTEDAQSLVSLATGPAGFAEALWALSQYFSQLAQ